MTDHNANGLGSLIDMKTTRLFVVHHLHDNDQKRFSFMLFYERYIAGATSNFWTQQCLSYPTPQNVILDGEVCQDDPELRRVLTRSQNSDGCCWLINYSTRTITRATLYPDNHQSSRP